MYSINDPANFDEEPPEGFEEEDFSPGEDDLFPGVQQTKGLQKELLRITWNPYEMFSSEFLHKHYELVLRHILHHIQAFLLFPGDCSCKTSCLCHEWRSRVILSLSTEGYTAYGKLQEKPNTLHAMKLLWHIPEDHVFRESYSNAYPLWLIKKALKRREENGHFKMIDQLVWTFLRLGQTYKICIATREASLTEATGVIVGGMPIKAKGRPSKKADVLSGEKTYEKLFKRYTSVCHFIAALEFCKKEDSAWNHLFESSYPSSEQIERFLSVAHWFRQNLLSLKRRNVKKNVFLKEEELCPLPHWFYPQDIDLPIEPFRDIAKELLSNVEYIDPVTKVVKIVDLYEEVFPPSP